MVSAYRPLDPSGGFLGTRRPLVSSPSPVPQELPRRSHTRRTPAPELDATSTRGLILRALGDVTRRVPCVGVSIESVVVRAWEIAPHRFGLAGYEDQHPDSNRVVPKIAGADGLCGMGFAKRTDRGEVALTHLGAAWCRRSVARAAREGVGG